MKHFPWCNGDIKVGGDHCCWPDPEYVRLAASALGRKGGKAGKGAAKVRGDSAYYKALRAKATKPKH